MIITLDRYTEPINVFKPFTVHITVETLQEARLLFHVVNRANLKEALMCEPASKGYFGYGDYSLDFAESLGLGYKAVREEIQRQGFSL